MKKIRKQLMILTLTLAFILIFSGTVSAAEWTVNPGQNIQTAIDGAAENDTITVNDGGSAYTYTENVTINKRNLTVKANGTVIVRTPYPNVPAFIIEPTGSYSTITGFIVTGTTNSGGIHLRDGTTNCNITGNTVTGNLIGIYLYNSPNNNINDNELSGNTDTGILLAASSNGNMVSGNTINNVPYGIDMNTASNNIISGNTITGSSQYGIRLFNTANGNTISGNTINNNANGVFIWLYSNGNTISGNTLTNNENGIYLHSSSNGNTISGNTLNSNINGVYIYSSYNNIVNGNSIVGNLSSSAGVTLDDPAITGNQVIGNTITGYNYGLVSNAQSAEVHFNRIVANRIWGLWETNIGTVNATYNWWGTNNNVNTFINSGNGIVYYAPWLFMTISANPTTINNRETSLITVSFNNQFDGTTVTPFIPSPGHIPDGTPVTFNAERSIGGSSTTSGGIATATLTADGAPGEADINAVTDSQTVNTSVMINSKSSLYLTVTPSKTNPVAGDTVVYTLKVGNNGPDAAENVVMTYVIPEGLEFVGATDDTGNTWKYDSDTSTITWNVGSVPKGDPNLWLTLRVAQAGQYLINPVLSTSTYDPTLNTNTQSITVNAAAQTITTVNAASNTVGMQETGIPLPMMVLAILMVLGGLIGAKRK